MRALAAAIVLTTALIAAASPAAAAPPPLRGAQTHPLWGGSTPADAGEELDTLSAAGANAVRIDIGWSTLEETAKGSRASWYVAKMDGFLDQAEERGIEVIVVFWTTPCWASSAPDDLKQGCAGAWWDRGVHYYPPTDPDDFADAVAWVADRWGSRLAAIELWNEANYSEFWRTSDPVGDYAELIEAAYPRVKAEAPDLTVIGPGLLQMDALWLDSLYDHGGGAYLDGISSHPFVANRSPYDEFPEDAKRSYSRGSPWMQQVMEENGDGDKRQWLTEIGWSSCAPGASVWCVTQETQAQHIGEALDLIVERWDFVEAAIVYNLRNKGTSPTDRESQMGLVHQDFDPKPSYDAFADALGAMASWEPPPPAPEPPPADPPPDAGAPQSALEPAAPPTIPVPAPAVDTEPPALSRLAMSRRRVRFRLSEAATVHVRIRRRRASAARRAIRVHSDAAAGAGAIRIGGLADGRYRLKAWAVDAAGNRGVARRLRFRLR